MAYIDHTRLVWKNGKYINYGIKMLYDGEIVRLCPFDYGRDGNIIGIKTASGSMLDISKYIQWHQDEYDALYQRKGVIPTKWWKLRSAKHLFYYFRNWFNWKLRRKELVAYRYRVGTWSNDNIEIYIYHDPLKSSYVSFYRDGSDSYVMLGGYGHHENVYTHFVSRGYGEDFEEAMAKEAYKWCCKDVLTKVAELVFNDGWDDNGKITELMEKFYVKEE